MADDDTWAEAVARFEAVHRAKYRLGDRVTAEAIHAARAAVRDHMRIPAELLRQSGRCLACRQPITVMINHGTGACSETCRKQLAQEDGPDE